MKFTAAAIMSPPYWKADKSCRLTFHTAIEMDKENLLKILDSAGSEGWLLWSPNEIDEKEIPTAEAHVDGKTPSERLRGKIYRLWVSLGKEGDFFSFYNSYMDKIIEAIDKRLQ